MDLHDCAFKYWQTDFSPANQNCIAFPAVMVSKKNIYVYQIILTPAGGACTAGWVVVWTLLFDSRFAFSFWALRDLWEKEKKNKTFLNLLKKL